MDVGEVIGEFPQRLPWFLHDSVQFRHGSRVLVTDLERVHGLLTQVRP